MKGRFGLCLRLMVLAMKRVAGAAERLVLRARPTNRFYTRLILRNPQ